MTNNMSMQLSKVLGFKATQATTMVIMNTGPRTHESFGLYGGVLFVASVSFTCSVHKGAGHMMLRGSDVGENSRTETTLIGNDKKVQSTTHVMAWRIRHDLMIDKPGVGTGHKLTRYSFMHNVAREHTTRLIMLRVNASIRFSKLMSPHSPEFRNIDRCR